MSLFLPDRSFGLSLKYVSVYRYSRSSATLSRLPTLLARNAELHSTVDELQRRNASAEHDIRELEGTINEIDGNDNPQQHKIQMLSRVREDLKDSRRVSLSIFLPSIHFEGTHVFHSS